MSLCENQNPGTRDENGNPYWPTCELPVGHTGRHRSGHFQDVMWSWANEAEESDQ